MLSFITLSVFLGWAAFSEEPPVGEAAAQKYFKERPETPRSPAGGGRPRYLALHLGTSLDDAAYRWGDRRKEEDVGQFSGGVSYRIGEWKSSMDLLLRVDFLSYEVDKKRATKMSVLPLITFPDANSAFPLYFGGGLGLGVFFKQLEDESSLSLDYQLLAGARFFDLLENVGFLFEVGLKNHLHLLSDGQHNGLYGALGALFTF